MDLTLFVVLLSLSLILIAIGLFRPEHTELALVGFVFLFLLSLVLIVGDLQYKTGYTERLTYGDNYTGYHWDYDYALPPGAKEVNLFHINRTYTYQDVNIGGGPKPYPRLLVGHCFYCWFLWCIYGF